MAPWIIQFPSFPLYDPEIDKVNSEKNYVSLKLQMSVNKTNQQEREKTSHSVRKFGHMYNWQNTHLSDVKNS